MNRDTKWSLVCLLTGLALGGAVIVPTYACSNPPPPSPTSHVETVTTAAPAGSVAWEYKKLLLDPGTHERLGAGASTTNLVPLDEDTLNKLGADGWELCGSWVESETAYPNFSPDAAFFTGLQPNVRPMRAVLLFKRRKP